MHNSRTVQQYDYLFLEFELQSDLILNSTNQRSEIGIVVDLRSQKYQVASDTVQDLKVNSDANLFINEQRGQFTNGENFPFKLYWKNPSNVFVDVTNTTNIMTLQFGQWWECNYPIRFRIQSQNLTKNSRYQIRIPMLVNPNRANEPLNLDFYVQERLVGQSVLRNISYYSFKNYARYLASTVTSRDFSQVVESTTTNRAQSKDIRYKIQLSNLQYIDLTYADTNQWFILKWDISFSGIDYNNLKLFTNFDNLTWEVDYYQDLTVYFARRLSTLSTSSDSISFDIVSPSDRLLYNEAIYTDFYGLKYAATLKAGSTRYVQSAYPKSTLSPATPIRYIKVALQDYNTALSTFDFIDSRSIYQIQIDMFTPKIPSQGSILITLKSGIISVPQYNQALKCLATTKIPRSATKSFQCRSTNSGSQILIDGFEEISLTNEDLDATRAISIKFFIQLDTDASITLNSNNQQFVNTIIIYGSVSKEIIRSTWNDVGMSSSVCVMNDLLQSCKYMGDPNFLKPLSNSNLFLDTFATLFNQRILMQKNVKSILKFEFQLNTPGLTSFTTDSLLFSLPQSLNSFTRTNKLAGESYQEYYHYRVKNLDSYYIRAYNRSTPNNIDDPELINGFTMYNSKPLLSSNLYELEWFTRFSLNNDFALTTDSDVQRFWLQLRDSTGDRRIAYYDLPNDALPLDSHNDAVFTARPILQSPNQISALRVQIKLPITVDASANDEIWLEFITNDKINNLFDPGLGIETFLGSSSTYPEGLNLTCFEVASTTVLTFTKSNIRSMDCRLFRGIQNDHDSPAILKIRPRINFTNQLIEFYVFPIKTPLINSIQVPITLKVVKQCRSGTSSNTCVKYQTHTYFYTSPPGTYSQTSSSITVQPGQVGRIETDLILNSTVDLALGPNKFFYITYPPSLTLPSAYNLCQNNLGLTTLLDFCIIIPSKRSVLVKIATQTITDNFSLVIRMQNNPKIAYIPESYALEIWDYSSAIRTTSIVPLPTYLTYSLTSTTMFKFTTIYTNRTNTSVLAFQPGSYMYWITEPDEVNYVQLDLGPGLWSTPDVVQFWVYLSSQIQSIDTTYCNATLQHTNPTLYRTPFPPKLDCTIDNTNKRINLQIIPREVAYILKAWTQPVAEIQNFGIRIFLKMTFDSSQKDTLVQGFSAYSQGTASTLSINSYYLIAQTTLAPSTYALPYKLNGFPWPYVRLGRFVKQSFGDSKATINDPDIQYYMIFQPNTLYADYPITRIRWTLPPQFGIPARRDLSGCKIQYVPTQSCILQRQISRFVDMVPELVDPDDSYRHKISIIEIGDPTFPFTAPRYPGNHYEMTVECWSSNILVEKATIKLSNVQGLDLSQSAMRIVNLRDANQLGYHQFTFQIGYASVPPGYDYETFTTYSRIIFTFDTANGYTQSVGAAVLNGEELGCLAVTGLTTVIKLRLTCTLKYGTGPEDLPQIIVSGYDEIKPQSIVTIMITDILTLNISRSATIQMGVELVYKDFGGVSSYYYGPRALTPLSTTALNKITRTSGTATYVGPSEVLQTGQYQFTIDLSKNVTTSDYIQIQFPKDFFERYSDYSSVESILLISPAYNCTNSTLYIFGISNQIFLQPGVLVAANRNLTVILTKMVSPAYKFASSLNSLTVRSIVDRKIDVEQLFQIQRQVQACSRFQYLSAKTSTSIGNQNGVTYTIDLITGHQVPGTGALSLQFPSEYEGNLYELNATCTLVGFGVDSICRFGDYDRVDVLLKGFNLRSSSLYQIVLQNLNNPSQSGLQFQILSYYSDNIYLDYQICQQIFDFPLITPVPIRQCNLFTTADVTNINLESRYTWQFQCQDNVRDDSIILIQFQSAYKQNLAVGDLTCSSLEVDTLAWKTCSIVMIDQIYYFRAQLRAIPSQRIFTLQATLMNPATPGKYNFSATFVKNDILYLQALYNKNIIQYIDIIDNPSLIQTPASFRVLLENIPKNTGEKAFYVFSVPPITSSVNVSGTDTVTINFPTVFTSTLGSDLQCGFYKTSILNQSFINYRSLLEVTQRQVTNYSSLSCSASDRTLTIRLTTNQSSLLNISQSWTHWIIRNINNPDSYLSTGQFRIVYQQESTTQWSYSENLVYFITPSAEFVSIQDLSTSLSNIKQPSTYNFYLNSESTFSKLLPINVLVSLKLPSSLYTNVRSLQSAYTLRCQGAVDATVLPTDLELGCELYTDEIVFDVKSSYLQTGNISNLVLRLQNLINPDTITSCPANNDIQLYQIRLMDSISKEIVYQSASFKNKKNCLVFKKQLFTVEVFGPSVLQQGLSYTFTIQLERPGDLLYFEPSTDDANIVFEPSRVEFNNFQNKTSTFLVSVRPSAALANHTIRIVHQQPDQYTPVLPFTVQVLAADNTILQKPLVRIMDVDVDTIGYPIVVPVVLTQKASNLMYLRITKSTDLDNVITISPRRLLIDTDTLETSFQITIATDKVPPSTFTLTFQLSSFYKVIHELEPKVKYFEFYRSNKTTTRPPSLHVILANTITRATEVDLGKSVMNVNKPITDNETVIQIAKTSVLPHFIKVVSDQLGSNSAQILAFVNDDCYIYYVMVLDGSTEPTQTELVQQTYKNSLENGLQKTQIRYPEGDIKLGLPSVMFKFQDLLPQTNYALFLVATNPLGNSAVYKHSFRSTRVSFGCTVRIPVQFDSAADINAAMYTTLIEKLGLSLRIAQERLEIVTNLTDLQSLQQMYIDSNGFLKVPEFVIEVMVKPNSTLDTPTPLSYCQLLEKSDYADTFKRLFPLFDTRRGVTSTEIRKSTPQALVQPYILRLEYYEAQIGIKLWENGTLYALIREKSDDPKPFSSQIYLGLNRTNQPIRRYRQVSVNATAALESILTFEDLKDNTNYQVYITASSQLPYTEAVNLYEDSQVISYEFKTPINPNLQFNEVQLLKQMEDINPELAKALMPILLQQENQIRPNNKTKF